MIPKDHSSVDDPARSDLGKAAPYGEQTGADRDQTSSDHDQDVANRDQMAANRDQMAANRDQAASDHDQAASDHDLARGRGGEGYDSSRATRDDTTRARKSTSAERRRTAHLRDETARERDQAALMRDRAAEARDRQADDLDAEIVRSSARLEPHQPAGETQIPPLAARDRAGGVVDSPGSASQRGEAAHDRAEAAHDRLSAAQDRDHAAAERDAAGVGAEPGAAQRGRGLASVQREIDSARRRDVPLVVAYVDLDRRQTTEDIDDQDAAEDRVKQLIGVIKAHLVADELIIRLGGDEFLCSLPGAVLHDVTERVEDLAEQLTASPFASRVNMGLAELVLDDHAIDLVERARAHAGLLAARHGSVPETH